MRYYSLLILICIGSTATATSYFVSVNGEDSNPGTKKNPWKTIEKVNNIVQPGDTVYFKNTDTWTSPDAPVLMLKGGVVYDGATWGAGTKATLKVTANQQGNNPDPVVYFQEDDIFHETVLSGFDIDGAGFMVNGIGVNWPVSKRNLNGTTKRIEHCIVHDVRGPDLGTFGIYGIKIGATGNFATCNTEVTDNTVFNTARSGIVVYDAVTEGSHYIDNVVIRKNEVFKAGRNPGSVGNGISLKDDVRNVVIEFNVSHDNPGRGVTLGNGPGRPGPKNATIKNNIIYNNGKGGVYISQAANKTVEIYSNLIFKNQKKGSGGAGIYFETNLRGTISARIYNNTIYDNANGSILINSEEAEFSVLEIKNNILSPPPGRSAIAGHTGKITSQSNNLTTKATFKNTSNLPDGFSGSFGTNLRPNKDGLSIESGPAINGGINLGSKYNSAINSVKREDDWDIGAYESVF